MVGWVDGREGGKRKQGLRIDYSNQKETLANPNIKKYRGPIHKANSRVESALKMSYVLKSIPAAI